MPDLFEALRLFITNSDDRARLDVGGELDVATVAAFRDHLELLVESVTGDVDVDMALVTFCDATTLTVLVDAHHRLDRLGRRLHVINGSPPVVRLLEVTALDAMLFLPTDEADASVDSCRQDAGDATAIPQWRPHEEGPTRCRSTSTSTATTSS